MARAATVDDYRLSEARFNETGALLGEMAALLSDVADCMIDAPARFAQCISEAEWPSFDKLQTMTGAWVDRRDELMRAWQALSFEDKIAVGSLPDFDAPDPLSPLV
jgi:hypothetical protein